MSVLEDKLYSYGLRAGDTVDPPVLSATVYGTTGSTSYSYRATFTTLVGETTPTDVVTVANGYATLGSSNYNVLTISAIPAAATAVRYYKLVGSDYCLLYESTDGTLTYNDIGAAVQATVIAPTENTSGRPQWQALLFNDGQILQRQELMDLQWIMLRGVRDLGDTIYQDGDIMAGGSPKFVSGTQWNFSDIQIYLVGQKVTIPGATVTLTGTGNEMVGIIVTPTIVTDSVDPVMRDQDEGVDLAYAQAGAYRLVYTYTWGVNQVGQVDIQPFIDNVPKITVIPPDMTVLDRTISRRINDLAGSFVVRNFPMQVIDHPTDDTKLLLKLDSGKAYPVGCETQFDGSQSIAFNKARNVMFDNGSSTDNFDIPGGIVIGAGPFPANVDGKNLKLKVGNGNYYTVGLTGVSESASQIATQILNSVNAYPTTGSDALVACAYTDTAISIQAAPGKTLEIAAAASNDVCSAIGLTQATYQPQGTRVYPLNDAYIKDVTDIVYKTETVGAFTYNGTTHQSSSVLDTNLVHIVGASTAEADCNDGKFDYLPTTDFVKSGDYIAFTVGGGAAPGNGTTFYVKYQYNKNATKAVRNRVRVTDAQIVKGTTDGKDTLTFASATSVTNVATGEAVTLTGNAKDVIRILKINATAGQSTSQYPLGVLNSNYTALAYGDSYIDWAGVGNAGTQMTGQPSPTATYYGTFELWQHATEGDVICADSYNEYDQIGILGSTKLRDCLDFRTAGGVMPMYDENPIFDYEYYLSRCDKLTLDANANFSLMTGNPAVSPAPIPADQDNVLSLAIVSVPPYTYGASDVNVISIQPMRMTQSQLQNLEKRVAYLEYWQVTNDLETQVANHSVSADKPGIYTDSLTGFNKVDLSFNKGGIKSTAAIDITKNTGQIPVQQTFKSISADLNNSTGIVARGNSLILDYQEDVYATQPLASETINVNPDNIFNYNNAIISLTPGMQAFVDNTQAPTLNVDFDNNLAPYVASLYQQANPATSSTLYGAWRVATPTDIATGTYDGVAGHTNEVAESMGLGGWRNVGMGATFAVNATTTTVTPTLIPETITRDLGNSVVDMSMVPMMKTTDDNGNPFQVHVSALGLIPNGDFAVSIGGVGADFIYDTSVGTPKGSAGSTTYSGFATAKADTTGALTGYFVMPQGVQAGSQVVKVFLGSAPADCTAQSNFLSYGFQQTTQDTTVGFQTLESRPTNVVTTDTTVQTVSSWGDPLAMSFLVPDKLRYTSTVKIYFATKSATMPITLDIRQMSNGYPTRTVLATCTVEAADVLVSNNGLTATPFTFENILGYSPDEYGFVLMTNCDDYTVWTATVGAIDINSGQMIASRPYGGVLFHSPNNSTWEAIDKQVMKFDLLESNFTQNCQIVWSNISGVTASQLVMKVEQFLGAGTNAHWSYSIDGGTRWIGFDPTLDTDLGSIITAVQIKIDVTSVGASYQVISSIAGMVLLYHDASADYIGSAAFFTDITGYPNKIVFTCEMDTDGLNGAGVRTVTPYYSVDDGVTWVEMEMSTGYTSVACTDSPWYTYEFDTPPQQTVTAISNTTPAIASSSGNLFKDGAIVTIASTGGDYDGDWLVGTSTVNGFTLLNLDGTNSAANGAFSGQGTCEMKEFTSLRGRLNLATTNRAVTPQFRKIGLIGAVI